MRNFTLIIIIGVFFSACTRRSGETVPVLKKMPVSAVIADSLYLSFPGQLRVTSAHILVTTPFNPDGFLKIYDRATGRESGWIGDRGQGPEEWNMPSMGNAVGDRVLIFDSNMGKYVLAEAGNMYGEISAAGAIKKMDLSPSAMVFADGGLFVVANYEETPFRLLSDGAAVPCGKYPFAETVSNTYERFQGSLAVHPAKGLMAYGTVDNPYLSLYRIRPGGLEQVWEKQFKSPDYSISDGQLHWGSGQPAGVREVTFTRDYIACLTEDERNRENTFSMYSRGMEMKVPLQSIYLFDYEGNLLYILDPDTHIIRLASDTDSNILYAVGINPDFRILMFDTDRALAE